MSESAKDFKTTLGARMQVWNVPTEELPDQMVNGTIILRISMDAPDGREALVALSPMDQLRLVNNLEALRRERQP